MKGSKRAEVSASEDEVDSEFEDDVDDAEGPTLVTVDDGKGGVKHVKVAHLHHLHYKLCHTKDELSENVQRALDPPSPFPTYFWRTNIADLWVFIDVCDFWHRFTVKYILNVKENLQYRFLDQT